MAEEPEITVVAVVRNRPYMMVARWLVSLIAQFVRPRIILVDYGSKPETIKWEQALIGTGGWDELVVVERDVEVFRQGRGFNIGLKRVKTPFVVFLNVDGVYGANFIEVILEELKNEDGEHAKLVCCERINLDEQEYEIGHAGQHYIGDCMALRTSVALDAHGFDEFYTWWGDLDIDFAQRITDHRAIKVWVTDKTRMLHQWHPTNYNPSATSNAEYRLSRPRGEFVRNGETWGEL